MFKRLIGWLGLQYALYAPDHRGKFRALWFLDLLFGPFALEAPGKISLSVFLSSSMDVSYFRKVHRKQEKGGAIDELAPALIDRLPEGSVMIDIGSNIGFLTIQAAHNVGSSGLVIAIEPSRREYGRLLTNLTNNRINNVIPIHAAIGESTEIAAFTVEPHHTGLNRLRNNTVAAGPAMSVPVFCGTDLLAGLLKDRRPSLIKIDVEGAELRVLRGLRSYLTSHRPNHVIVEITPRFLADFGGSKDEVYQLMKEIGFEPTVNGSSIQYDEVFQPATTQSGDR